MNTTPVAATIAHLRECQRAKRAGYPVAFTTDAIWLVHQAINRRAGWLDDPSGWRGSCCPVNGQYPAKAKLETYRHLRLISHEVNTPRLIVRAQRLGEWQSYLLARIPNRITLPEDE